jgi:hypothetical protein
MCSLSSRNLKRSFTLIFVLTLSELNLKIG